MSSFTTPLVVSPLPDGRRWRLVFQFGYDVGREGSGDRITVPVGFVTDFASIPKFLYWLLPWWAKFNKASVLHDCLYRIKKIGGRPITRKRADNVWLEAMLIDFRNHKSGELIARIEYRVVRLLGFPAW
ncbi:hypothetical protein LCGC14_1503790 [marine sediment metagenome]|uniref:DUF1353 domain-containing protein n=1 Tax=marine sediment metagenome TaxID=412755 RepID=A0A0F9JP49_9ZZZZ